MAKKINNNRKIRKRVLALFMFAEIEGLPYLTTDQIYSELQKHDISRNSVTNKISMLKRTGKIIKPKGKKIGDRTWKIEPAFFKTLESKYTKKIQWKKYRPSKSSRLCTHLKYGKDKRRRCAITGHIIGNPHSVCGIMSATIISNNGKPEHIAFPICEGYWNGSIDAISIRVSKERLEQAEQERSLLLRYHLKNIRDPISKFYLPNLVEYESHHITSPFHF